MRRRNSHRRDSLRIVVIGAGAGGLAAALRLAADGHNVTVLDAHGWPGGKMRTVDSPAGRIDAGPTVLTMRHVFDDLFHAAGGRLDDYLKLIREPCLARHFWSDGSSLDLFDDRDRSARAVESFAGSAAARQFRRFAEEAQRLFEAFDRPMMQCAEPSFAALAGAALKVPAPLRNLSPAMTLARKLSLHFTDPRLRQLFGRYATYVGGSPFRSPAFLSLIWRAEEAGVWRAEGGLQRLAEAMAGRFRDIGGILLQETRAARIEMSGGRVSGVALEAGSGLAADAVVYAGDPRALATGRLGPAAARVAKTARLAPRSYSARVWSFAARLSGPELLHHNVFFASDPASEFTDLAAGRTPSEPTIYVCAQDRGAGLARPPGDERFEIILNAPALPESHSDSGENETCRLVTFDTLKTFGVRFQPDPPLRSLTAPAEFELLFPGSGGSLYGQSPEGMTASLKRPRARTAVRGLYLAGGGTHPGAGVPMSALSGRHAAEAITADLASKRWFRRAATHGGISTA